MKEIPMLFSTSMVQAILRGTKTQTRRVVKYSKEIKAPQCGFSAFSAENEFSVRGVHKDGQYGESLFKMPYCCKDVIRVKETFYALGEWVKNGKTKTGKQKYRFRDRTPTGNYGYYDSIPENVKTDFSGGIGWYKRPSLFMPKTASRISLKITNIRIERLNDISEKDAIAEGIYEMLPFGEERFENYGKYDGIAEWNCLNPIDSYESLWESINGKDSWAVNPWVWVVEFEKNLNSKQ